MVDIKPSGPLQVTVLFEASATDYLWIDPGLAGRWWPFGEDSGVAVRFPSVSDEADIDPRAANPAEKTNAGGTIGLGAALIQARVDVPATVSQWETADSIVVARGRARQAVAGFLTWCKVRQPWIGAYDSSPEPLDDVLVTSTETGEAHTEHMGRPGRRREGVEVRLIDELPLRNTDVEVFIERASRGHLPDASSAFLADSYFAAFCSEPRDLKRAVLLAAFACEIRIRRELGDHAGVEARATFDRWFPEQRQARKPVSEWLGRVAKTLVNRSLEEEDPGLLEKWRRLVRVRNELAHQGIAPELDDALEGVRSARKIFQWLDSW